MKRWTMRRPLLIAFVLGFIVAFVCRGSAGHSALLEQVPLLNVTPLAVISVFRGIGAILARRDLERGLFRRGCIGGTGDAGRDEGQDGFY